MFQLMNFMAIKNIKQLHHFTFSSVNLGSVSCQVDTLAEEEVHRILTDELNDALAKKDSSSFWKTWQSKFSRKRVSPVIDGICDPASV